MKVTLTMEFYARIMCATDEIDIIQLTLEIEAAAMTGVLDDTKDIMILNLALATKQQYFMIKELVIAAGGALGLEIGHDPEEEQLEEFRQEEFEDFKDGNVVLLGDFKKDKK